MSVNTAAKNRAKTKGLSSKPQARPAQEKHPAAKAPHLWETLKNPLGWLVALAAVCVGFWFWNAVDTINEASGLAVGGFPLDDSWIHLTFARTFAQTGRFAYGPLNAPTSGSTSPLFTLLESLLFLFTSNEFLIAKLLSIAGFAFAVFFVYRAIEAARPKLAWAPVAAAILVLVSPRFFPASVWGMETTFAGAFIAAAAYYYERRAWLALGIVLGLGIWCRPDLILLSLAIAVDYYLLRREEMKPDWMRLLIPAVALGAAYLLFNFALSGSALPNTFAAKLAYYKLHRPGFWSQAWEFFTAEGQGLTMALAILCAIGALLKFSPTLSEKAKNIPLYPALIAIGYIALYAWKLPYLYQDGRYLVPASVALALGAAFGAIWIGSLIAKRTTLAQLVPFVLILVAAFIQLNGMSATEPTQHEAAAEAYISRLQVATAKWCADSLPKSAIIATHDIGAIGFYSGRKTVDIVGLADPGIIPHLGDPKATVRFMRQRGANYAALLDNWFEIVNENPAYIIAPPGSERMLIYPLTDSSRLAGDTVLSIHKYIRDAIAGADATGFSRAVQVAINVEPDDALTYTLAGEYLLQNHKESQAIALFQRALQIFPNSVWALRDLEFANRVKR